MAVTHGRVLFFCTKYPMIGSVISVLVTRVQQDASFSSEEKNHVFKWPGDGKEKSTKHLLNWILPPNPGCSRATRTVASSALFCRLPLPTILDVDDKYEVKLINAKCVVEPIFPLQRTWWTDRRQRIFKALKSRTGPFLSFFLSPSSREWMTRRLRGFPWSDCWPAGSTFTTFRLRRDSLWKVVGVFGILMSQRMFCWVRFRCRIQWNVKFRGNWVIPS